MRDHPAHPAVAAERSLDKRDYASLDKDFFAIEHVIRQDSFQCLAQNTFFPIACNLNLPRDVKYIFH